MSVEYEFFDKSEPDFPIGLFSQTIYFDYFHHHIEYELFYLDKGSCIFCIDNTEHHIQAGTVIFIEPGVSHLVKAVADGATFHYHALVFDPAVFGSKTDACRRIFDKMKIKRFLTIPPELLKCIERMTILQATKSFGYQVQIKSVLMTIISYVIETHQYMEIISDPVFDKKSTSVSAIDTAIRYIQDHYRENICLDDLLKTTNYCKSHFIRLFKSSTGMKFTDYVNMYRIEKSCLDLIYSDKNITEIARDNGFNNIQYFSKIFKEYMNCTPMKYKKNGKDITVPSTIANIGDFTLTQE
ncbi:MAG: AraC family transcriptional regulator [Treponema sp.]|nr:AraC family transcriptional regulator [Candidatus Treponema caballi]